MLVHWLGIKGRQTFTLKCFFTPKKKKRRLKRRFTIKLVTVHSKARVNTALKAVHFLTEEQSRRAFEERIFLTLLDGLFKYKDGLLQKRRLYTYRAAIRHARNQGGGFTH